ncbi:MAG TPA: hypothetical protein VGP96_14270 [Candidatus Dormibacteraeota bacterium]|nr:hypothetical protein [Candidatus Dormibacteraeota bacterium]
MRARAGARPAVRRLAAGAMVLGAVALVLGALMPWARLTVPIAGTLTRSGIDSGADAVLCIAVGVAACLVGLRALLSGGPASGSATERTVVGVMGVLGLVCAAFALVAARHVEDRLGSLLDRLPDLARRLVTGEVGAGIWVVGAGGAVIAAAALAQVLASAPGRG